MPQFTIYEGADLKSGLVGGLILGASSSAFMYLTGRITGISGILENAMSVSGDSPLDGYWPVSYIVGLMGSGYFLKGAMPAQFGVGLSALRPEAVCVAALLTGFGTRMGSGCTSG